jgi:hypothetical protein
MHLRKPNTWVLQKGLFKRRNCIGQTLCTKALIISSIYLALSALFNCLYFLHLMPFILFYSKNQFLIPIHDITKRTRWLNSAGGHPFATFCSAPNLSRLISSSTQNVAYYSHNQNFLSLSYHHQTFP